MWVAVPSILWVLLAATIIYWLRSPLLELIEHLIDRVRAGAALKFGSVEVGAIRTAQDVVPAPAVTSSVPESGFPAGVGSGLLPSIAIDLASIREQYYVQSRRIMLVHRLYRSTKPNQVYDILIYLVPHPDGSLIEVVSVEYFFGRYWGNHVLTSTDRSRGFPILTAAYGSFLCQARLHFNDNIQFDVFRYIDFEMGAYAPVLADKISPGS